MVLLTFVIMVPGMITGSSTASVLTSGAVVAPMFVSMGMTAIESGALISIAAILGMIAPPVNIPAMIIGGGIDMPYVGFELPLMLLTFPLAIVFALWFGWRKVRHVDRSKVLVSLDFSTLNKYGGWRLFSPLILIFVLMILDKTVPSIFGLGMPLIFMLGTMLTWITGKRFNILQSAKKSIEDVLPVLGILVGVGMFIQIMTATGVRGFIVVNALSVPPTLLYVMIAISIPLFGAISAFGSSSVLGVPFYAGAPEPGSDHRGGSTFADCSHRRFYATHSTCGDFRRQSGWARKVWHRAEKLVVPAIIIIVYAILFIVFSKQIRAVL